MEDEKMRGDFPPIDNTSNDLDSQYTQIKIYHNYLDWNKKGWSDKRIAAVLDITEEELERIVNEQRKKENSNTHGSGNK